MKICFWLSISCIGLMVPSNALQPSLSVDKGSKKDRGFSLYHQKDIIRAGGILMLASIAGIAFYKGLQLFGKEKSELVIIKPLDTITPGAVAGREHAVPKKEEIVITPTTNECSSADNVMEHNSQQPLPSVPMESKDIPSTVSVPSPMLNGKDAIQVLLAAEENKEDADRVAQALNLLFKDVKDEGEYWAVALQPLDFDSLRTIGEVMDSLKTSFIINYSMQDKCYKVRKKK